VRTTERVCEPFWARQAAARRMLYPACSA